MCFGGYVGVLGECFVECVVDGGVFVWVEDGFVESCFYVVFLYGVGDFVYMEVYVVEVDVFGFDYFDVC